MKYIGQEVIDSKFGKGTIISQDETGTIHVKFLSDRTIRAFHAPNCFFNTLHLDNPDIEKKAKLEYNMLSRSSSTPEIDSSVKREPPSSIKTKKSDKKTLQSNAPIPSYATSDAFYDDQIKALDSEISYLLRTGGKRTKLFDGKLIESSNGQYIYAFDSETELSLPDNTQISIWMSSRQDAIPATIISTEDFTILIASSQNIGKEVFSIEFSSESWRLLKSLTDRLTALRYNQSDIVQSIILHGNKAAQTSSPISIGQSTACKMSLSQPITFIWGPPGTGKTETLAKIALRHIQKKHRVLMLSYSNVSVDGAILRVYKKNPEIQPGAILRYGYPRDNDLLHHERLTSYNYALEKHPDLLSERKRILDERKHLPRSSSQYLETSRRLSEIKKKLDEEEKLAVRSASFVATTVSKAVVDKTIYDGDFDTVIFDEASMAYISQIVFSAGLAKKHFVCMGDFAQLPPIVQSTNNLLSIDIFRYCGITKAVQSGHGHKWLCMLDTQYRMYPEIANFVSHTIYHSLLKTGSGVAKQRKSIFSSSPFPNSSLGLVDLSGTMSVCTKTNDQSRINVLSAMISMYLALQYASSFEVGIITPYNAQSRLLHAMARDIASSLPTLNRISCATVHQFQGSEKDVIIYDAVDCYRMSHPGKLLTAIGNNYANRLYNVAVTRARGKMISVANVDYMKKKKLSSNLMFQQMIEKLCVTKQKSTASSILSNSSFSTITVFKGSDTNQFMEDLLAAKKEIHIDIPAGITVSEEWLNGFIQVIHDTKKKGVKVFIRVASKNSIPKLLRPLTIENQFIANSIAIIDKAITWFGMPFSNAEFISEETIVPTTYRPILRFAGKHFAQALFGFLDLNKTIDLSPVNIEKNENGGYDSFAAYVTNELKCSKCNGVMRLKKNKKFYLACSNYPACKFTSLISPDIVEEYLYFNSITGKKCPQDNSSLEARVGKSGLYICCNGVKRHFYQLDEI